MKQFKNILFVQGTYHSKRVLDQAFGLAARNNAKLKIVEVFEDISDDLRNQIKSMHAITINEILEQQLNQRLAEVINQRQTQKSKISSKVLYGTPFLEIIREILRDKHDLVIVGTEGKEAFQGSLLGSTVMHLMRKCPCPIWVVKPSASKRYSNIMAAVDITQASGPFAEPANALNQKIMALANSLAEINKGKLHVIHCWRQPLEERLRKSSSRLKSDVSKMISRTRKQHRIWLAEFLGKNGFDPATCQVHLLKGRAEKLIPKSVRKNRIDLIAMGTISRSGVDGFFIGNTAEKLLHQLNCSILAVKPDGFVSPVTLNFP